MSYPKVLVFGQPFNNYSGGGITLSNLFKGWPKDKIAVAYTGHGLINITTDICDRYYQLGKEEHRWKFPFNLFQRQFKSGPKTISAKEEVPVNFTQTGTRYKIVNHIFYPILAWFGLIHILTKILISERFKGWLSEIDPEILYLQVTALDEINFAEKLINYLKIPAIIHIMDDWPSTISNKGPFKKYWHVRIDKKFRVLLDRVSLRLSISDAMSVEYKKRYNKDFIAFHNPIEADFWVPFRKTDFKLDKNHITVLYSGRIGFGITESLYEIAAATNTISKNGLNIKLHIQTPTKDPRFINPLLKFESVVINPFASYEELPRIFSAADILLMINDFNIQGIDYLRYSMPTKASEYMISGTPVLVYSAGETAVSKFFNQNKCGFCINKQGTDRIIKALQFLINNEDYRRQVSEKAFNIAKERFNALNVRNEFQNLIINLSYTP